MILQTLPQRPSSGFLTSKILAHLGGWICGGVVLCWVASQAGPRTGTAVVHVTEPNVAVNIGGQMFQVGETIHMPLICDLPAGAHRLTMTRGTTVLYAENFSIEGGEEHVLTTWKPPADGASRAVNRIPWFEGSPRGGQFPIPSTVGNPWPPEANSHQ